MRDIKTLIDVMITFNLSYIQQRRANGENALVLEPPADAVAFFSDAYEKRGLSFGTRQMISKELLKERVKRNIRLKSNKQDTPMPVIRQIETTTVAPVKPKQPMTLTKLQPKTIVSLGNNAPRDFFAKFKLGPKKPATDGTDPVKKPVERKALISFSYNEGFSDAVRCKLKIQDLL